MYYAHLAFVRFEHSVCHRSLMTPECSIFLKSLLLLFCSPNLEIKFFLPGGVKTNFILLESKTEKINTEKGPRNSHEKGVIVDSFEPLVKPGRLII